MKLKYLIAVSLVGAFALNLTAQQSTRDSGQSPATSEGSLPPGLQKRDQLPPGLNRGGTLPPGLQKRQSADSGSTNSNAQTTAEGTNDSTITASATNSLGGDLMPTSDTNRAGRVYGTNQTNQTSASANTTTTTQRTETHQDHAYTQADRRLLVQIRQSVLPLVGSAVVDSAATTATPVYFIVREQTVTIVGQVPTAEQSQRIETAVEKVPGIVKVENQLRITSETHTEVGSSSSTSETSVAGATNSNPTGTGSLNTTNQLGAVTNNGSALTPTSNRTNGSSVYQGGTNSSTVTPTGRTNSNPAVPEGLPPGLQNRDQLPPGLEKRDQLPPGLNKRIGSGNNSTTNRQSE